jgi:Kef-type K+ transport system membrane component KefB
VVTCLPACQPKVVGEILAGILLGSLRAWSSGAHLSGAIFPVAAGSGGKHEVVLGFLYNLGLLLLMFASGAETKGLFNRQDRREVACLDALGTGLPFFLALAVAPFLRVDFLIGSANQLCCWS